MFEPRYRTTDPRWREAEDIRGPHEIARFHRRPENADPVTSRVSKLMPSLRRKVVFADRLFMMILSHLTFGFNARESSFFVP